MIQREKSVLQFYPRKDTFLGVQLLGIFSVFTIFSRKLRAAVGKYREFAVKTEISKIFIFGQKKPVGETFSKITISFQRFFFFFEKNRQKVKCCPTPYSRRSETFE